MGGASKASGMYIRMHCAYLYLPLVLSMGLTEVEAVAEQDRRGDCNLRQLEPEADVADEGAVGGPEPGLLGRADAVPPRRRVALDLLPAQVPRPVPLAALLPRGAHRDPRRRRQLARERREKTRIFPFRGRGNSKSRRCEGGWGGGGCGKA